MDISGQIEKRGIHDVHDHLSEIGGHKDLDPEGGFNHVPEGHGERKDLSV